MKISEILARKKTLSFEIFPPKREEETFTLIDKPSSSWQAIHQTT